MDKYLHIFIIPHFTCLNIIFIECHMQCYPRHPKGTSPTLFAVLPPTFDSSSSQAHELVMSLKVVLESFGRADNFFLYMKPG